MAQREMKETHNIFSEQPMGQGQGQGNWDFEAEFEQFMANPVPQAAAQVPPAMPPLIRANRRKIFSWKSMFGNVLFNQLIILGYKSWKEYKKQPKRGRKAFLNTLKMRWRKILKDTAVSKLTAINFLLFLVLHGEKIFIYGLRGASYILNRI